MSELAERLERGDIIILDGAISTEYEHHGVKMDDIAWSGFVNMTHPDIVRAVHVDYIKAGADVITTNTFGAARHVLDVAGRGDEAAAINRRAVELAREAQEEAADRPVWIAGSMSSMDDLRIKTTPTGERAKTSYAEQAQVLAEAGVDLILAEMMLDIENATIVLEAAGATGLPIWVGYSAEFGPDGKSVVQWRENEYTDLPGGDFANLVEAIAPLGGQAAGVMHSYPNVTGPALKILREHWSGPMMVYAESGRFLNPDWDFTAVAAPDEYLAMVREWVDIGAQIVGGCCGLGPEHIRRLKEKLPPRLPRAA
ncbi:MAG: homocysteine S-methyltransferase family protein [Proteobacteria bacterium]|nr:homocysteine S-methyltransferase family protein [Pseudomonadota bacterium]